ncbi:hypothetical protein N665_0094s0051 [Sinapis alba]|nr:hypothetical protein N665_0094s0051 [Sinapis alba]
MYMVWLLTLVLLVFSASPYTVLARLPCESSTAIGGAWNKKLTREMKIKVGGSSSRPAGQGRGRGRGH